MDVVALASALRAEARNTDERRLLVLAGDRDTGYSQLEAILEELAVPITATTLVGPEDRLRCDHLTQATADRLLGTTRDVVVVDVHEACRPNALGSVVGAIDGGGLLILLTPPLETWPDRRDAFDETLAAPPFEVDAVTGHFRRRLVDTLEVHSGIAIVDVDEGRIRRDGTTEPAPRLAEQRESTDADDSGPFPEASYAACRSADQRTALEAFEPFQDPSNRPHAVVLEADRGRGKSSAAGLAAGSLAASGLDVAVTAPSVEGCAEVFARARELVSTIDLEFDDAIEDDTRPARPVRTAAGGCVRFEPATEVESWVDGPDVVIVDEAAALPVSILESILAADRVAYATTVHGYEGTGRGFAVRFRDRLDESGHSVDDVSLIEPIRYAAGDPVETWAFRVLALDASPPVEPLVSDARPGTVGYGQPDAVTLRADEHRLRETFGLLVLAHYRTEPTDLARLLDAPNVIVRTLEHECHVVAVALLAREGGLDAETRAEMYEGARIRGNMIPDVLTSQLRDESAGESTGYRVVRIATHHAARSRGLGGHLLSCIREEFADDVDWLGSGFGATPELLRFWRSNGYRAVHASTTRNDRSGEYSAIVLSATGDRGRNLLDRQATWFGRRSLAVFSDALSDLDADTARELLRSVPATAAPQLPERNQDWRVIAGAAYGPGLFDVDPGPFRRLVCHYLIDEPDDVSLPPREERLLVRRALQGQPWPAVADALDFHSPGQCMRTFGTTLSTLVDHYGTDPDRVGQEPATEVRRLRDRFVEDEQGFS